MARVGATLHREGGSIARFRERKEAVTLYASGYGHEIARMRTLGFEDPDPPTYEPEEASPPGIRLQDVRSNRGWMNEALEVDLPEDLVLPYEVTKLGYVPRTFYVAAKVLNQALGKADAEDP